jgi:hypothetical protein
MDNTLKNWKKVVDEGWYDNKDSGAFNSNSDMANQAEEEEYVDMQQELPDEDAYGAVDDVDDDSVGFTLSTEKIAMIIDALRQQGNVDLADELEQQDADLRSSMSNIDRDVDPDSINVDDLINTDDPENTFPRNEKLPPRGRNDPPSLANPMGGATPYEKSYEGFKGKWDELVDRINENED